jgi:hypothetical protein
MVLSDEQHRLQRNLVCTLLPSFAHPALHCFAVQSLEQKPDWLRRQLCSRQLSLLLLCGRVALSERAMALTRG